MRPYRLANEARMDERIGRGEIILKTREFGLVRAVGTERGSKSERTREMLGHTVGVDGNVHSRRWRWRTARESCADDHDRRAHDDDGDHD